MRHQNQSLVLDLVKAHDFNIQTIRTIYQQRNVILVI